MHFYYSHLDWGRTDFYPRGRTGNGTGRPDSGDWNIYPQYELIHALQPGCLVGNNHHQKPYEGEDIQIFERDIVDGFYGQLRPR